MMTSTLERGWQSLNPNRNGRCYRPCGERPRRKPPDQGSESISQKKRDERVRKTEDKYDIARKF